MSGQVVRTDVYRKRATIDLVSAGEEQLVTCAPIVYLEATVNGDLNGHTFEWVQLTGTPTVTLLAGGTPLQAYYIVDGNAGSDKIFRFYIDRNTQIEQYADVFIRTTPTSVLNRIESAILPNAVDLLPFTVIEPFSLTGDFLFDIIPFNSEGKLLDSTDTYVTWKLPNGLFSNNEPALEPYRQGFLGTNLQQFNGNSWVDLQFYPLMSQRLYQLVSASRLRVASRFKLQGKQVSDIYSNWEDLEASSGNSVLAKEVLAQIANGVLSNDVVFDKIVYRLDIQQYNEDMYNNDSGIVNNDVSFNRIVFSLLEVPVVSTLSLISNGSINNVVTLTRVSGGVIGG